MGEGAPKPQEHKDDSEDVKTFRDLLMAYSLASHGRMDEVPEYQAAVTERAEALAAGVAEEVATKRMEVVKKRIDYDIQQRLIAIDISPEDTREIKKKISLEIRELNKRK